MFSSPEPHNRRLRPLAACQAEAGTKYVKSKATLTLSLANSSQAPLEPLLLADPSNRPTTEPPGVHLQLDMVLPT